MLNKLLITNHKAAIYNREKESMYKTARTFTTHLGKLHLKQ